MQFIWYMEGRDYPQSPLSKIIPSTAIKLKERKSQLTPQCNGEASSWRYRRDDHGNLKAK